MSRSAGREQKGENGTASHLGGGGFCQPCTSTILFQYETLLKAVLFFAMCLSKKILNICFLVVRLAKLIILKYSFKKF